MGNTCHKNGCYNRVDSECTRGVYICTESISTLPGHNTRIAVDLDDTLVDTSTCFQEWCESKLKSNLGSKEAYLTELMNIKGHMRNAFIASPAFDDLIALPRAIPALKTLKQNGYELVIVTSRQEALRHRTQTLVSRLFPGIFSAMYFTEFGKKGQICHSLGVELLIDDSLDQIFDALDHGVNGAVFDLNGTYTWNHCKELPPGAERMNSWDAVTNWVLDNDFSGDETVDQPLPSKPFQVIPGYDDEYSAGPSFELVCEPYEPMPLSNWGSSHLLNDADEHFISLHEGRSHRHYASSSGFIQGQGTPVFGKFPSIRSDNSNSILMNKMMGS